MTFKFEIGQLVTMLATVEECRLMSGGRVACGMIVDRMSQECPDGTQRFYAVRIGRDDLRRYNEIELVATTDLELADTPAVAVKERSPFELLQDAKELFVVELWFDAAAKVRDLLDELKKMKAEKDTQKPEPTP